DRVHHPLDEAIDDKERPRVALLAGAARQQTAIAELEDQRLALRFCMQVRGKRTDASILIGERKAGFTLVRCQQIETFELQDVAPAARHLTVRDAKGATRNSLSEARYRAPVENAVAKVAEYDRACRRLGQIAHDLIGLGIRDTAIVERIHFQ